ncbi:tRNA-dihydrouridine(20/20a) synthase [hydrothermal vent metagenome]|uniref:tRNA-dihydrouridine(20/20a) synthase n=1 Tax=hydrothermal vent metagenome TaxID=652676 RepID=A0A3B0TZH4_9ZZZZ
MMDWTDRHCRVFHRQICGRATLYTEMRTADAIRFGDQEHLLGFDPMENPVVLQLGGSDPDKLAQAARIGADYGYDAINLNCGCPSTRVRSGRFGACLMAEPDTVARAVTAMRAAVDVPVTVKCRIGIDDQDTGADLERFVAIVADAGVAGLVVHARKAWLKGLSPKENRDVPPLDYARVARLKADWPDLPIVLNGGIASLDAAQGHLARFDGVMLGRAAYQTPYIMATVDRDIYGEATEPPTRSQITRRMQPYIEAELARGTPLIAITRHMLGLYHARPGARHWRRILSEEGRVHGAGWEIVERALATVKRLTEAAATTATAA